MLFAQSPQPIEGVAANKLMLGWVDLVEREIAPAPLEVFARQIQTRGARARFGGAKREAAGVGEGVEDRRTGVLPGAPIGRKARKQRPARRLPCISQQRKTCGDMAREQSPPIVSLIKE